MVDAYRTGRLSRVYDNVSTLVRKSVRARHHLSCHLDKKNVIYFCDWTLNSDPSLQFNRLDENVGPKGHHSMGVFGGADRTRWKKNSRTETEVSKLTLGYDRCAHTVHGFPANMSNVWIFVQVEIELWKRRLESLHECFTLISWPFEPLKLWQVTFCNQYVHKCRFMGEQQLLVHWT